MIHDLIIKLFSLRGLIDLNTVRGDLCTIALRASDLDDAAQCGLEGDRVLHFVHFRRHLCYIGIDIVPYNSVIEVVSAVLIAADPADQGRGIQRLRSVLQRMSDARLQERIQLVSHRDQIGIVRIDDRLFVGIDICGNVHTLHAARNCLLD